MDIIFVRHKLHALIVINLIAENFISKNFIFVRQHWKEINEDSEKNDFFYKMLEEKAFYTIHTVEQRGLIKSVIQIYLLSILAFISSGKFYLAAITSYAYAIVTKLNPLLKIITFDDGMSNIKKDSHNPYFSNKALDDNFSILRSFLIFLFPDGTSSFMRKKTILHYTIYNDFENIVPREKLKYIKIDWESYLSNEDILCLNRFLKSEVSLLIGTVFPETTHSRLQDERKRNFVKNFQKEFLPKFDLIISHPRDSSSFSRLKISRNFHGLAESVIRFLQNQSMVKQINVYHFKSTAILTIKTLSKVKLYDIFADSDDIEDNSAFREPVAPNN